MANVQVVHEMLDVGYVHRALVTKTVELTKLVSLDKNGNPTNTELLRFIYPGFYGFHNYDKMITFIFMVNHQGQGEVAYIANSIPAL